MTRRPTAEWMMAAEAFLLLSAFRVALAFLPVRRIIPALTRPRSRSVRADNSDRRRTARRVEWAVRAAARHSPFEFVCFPQALAGYTMLRRRNVPSTVVYGVARSASGDLLAHTWLTVGDEVLLGREAAPEFAPIERWS